MGYETQTPNEAYFKVRRDRLAKIAELSLLMGVDLQPPHEKWIEDIKDPCIYARRHPFRDAVVYPRVANITQRDLMDSQVEVLDEEADYAVIQDCFNNTQQDSELEFEVAYRKEISVSETSGKKSTTGWSFESATEAGVEYSGVSFKETITVGAHGEVEKLRTLEKGDTNGVDSKIKTFVPFGMTYRVQQWENKSRIQVTSQELYLFDVAFEVFSHKDLYRGRIAGDALKDNHRQRRYPGTSHSYAMFSVHSTEDLHEILTGVSADYPNQRQNLLANHQIKALFDELTDADKWSFEVETKTPFDKGISGHIQVINLANGDVIDTHH